MKDTSVVASRQEPAIRKVVSFIHDTWPSLIRDHSHILVAVQDTKFPPIAEGGRWPLFISDEEDKKQVEARLDDVLTGDQRATVEVKRVSERLPNEHGLLWLPQPFVVPASLRFNEMYNWDSYFTNIGLLREGGHLALAKSMVENHAYQVIHYGSVLNANRTYYLTRSQPPFLCTMAREYFEAAGACDLDWLRGLMPALEKYHRFFTTEPHCVDDGLSRYYDFGEGPAPEVLTSEIDTAGLNHYERTAKFFREHPDFDYGYDLSLYYNAQTDTLTDLFYKGDRSMREAGCDVGCRLGWFNVDVIHYTPVCLNSLLYRYEVDLAHLHGLLGNAEQRRLYEQLAAARKAKINELMWDEAAGMFFDYNFHQRRRRHYPSATVFFPLWAGLASPEQAKRVVENALPLLERPGGLVMSDKVTHCQWDAPFGWAPFQLVAAQALLRYGFVDDARRLASKFVRLVTNIFTKTGQIYEKYDVDTLSGDSESVVEFGYAMNVVGFGWTNAVYLELLHIAENAALPTASLE